MRRVIADRRDERGVSYVMVLFTIAILGTLMTGFQREIASNHEMSRQAHYLARAGLNVAVWRVLNEAGFVDNNDGVPISSPIGGMSLEYMVEEAENNGSILVTSTGTVENATTVLRHLIIPPGAATVGLGDGILMAYDTNTDGSIRLTLAKRKSVGSTSNPARSATNRSWALWMTTMTLT